MTKAIIINCFDTCENRVDLVLEFLKGKGIGTYVIQSDFKHIKKIHRLENKTDYIFIKTLSYFKNISLQRLFSHFKFARDSFKVVEELKPDLLYIVLPPNSLAKFASIYKKKNRKTKLIFDVMDLWPETMPIRKFKNMIPFKLWRDLRNNSLKSADFVITECNLYQEVLCDVLDGIKSKTIYLAKKDINVISRPELSENEITLAYLGSINNIIDIPKIGEIIQSIKKRKVVTLHIIGNGESKQELIDTAISNGATVHYHGEIYDPQEKQDIFDKCHYGLNIMKDSVCVGLTMKSVDYFQHGLPIINNIPADTEDFVETYNIGFNVIEKTGIDDNNLEFAKIMVKRNNVIKIFNDKFSHHKFNSNLENIFSGNINLYIKDDNISNIE